MSDFVCPEGARLIRVTGATEPAIVDEADYEWLSEVAWHLGRGGYARTNGIKGHPRIPEGGAMHRIILGIPKGDVRIVDHANRNPLDNRRSNLRLASVRTNARNSGIRSHNRQDYKGVSKTKKTREHHAQSWGARIIVDGREVRLGTFVTQEEAARAYDSAAAHFFGEFAALNFPDQQPAAYVARDTHALKAQRIQTALQSLVKPSMSEVARAAGVSVGAVRTYCRRAAIQLDGAERAMVEGRRRGNAPRQAKSAEAIALSIKALTIELGREPNGVEISKHSGVGLSTVRRHLKQDGGRTGRRAPPRERGSRRGRA